MVTAALVYRYAVDPRHLHHHPSLHGGSLGGLARPGSSMGAGSAGSMGRLDPGSGTAGLSAAADLEGQRPGPRHAAPLTWQQVRRGDAQWGSLCWQQSDRMWSSLCNRHLMSLLPPLPCCAPPLQVVRDVRSVLGIRSFQIIVLQGGQCTVMLGAAPGHAEASA